MRWRLRHGDILDEPADVLICSANLFLTLSGGVGGALLLRYGDAMQRALNDHLRDHQRRYVERGVVVPCPPCGTPYAAVLHAVAVDGLYESSPEIVTDVVAKSLSLAAEQGARKVALTALGTGYGHLTMRQFGHGVAPVMERNFPPIEQVAIVVRRPEEVQALAEVLPGAEVA